MIQSIQVIFNFRLRWDSKTPLIITKNARYCNGKATEGSFLNFVKSYTNSAGLERLKAYP